MIFNFNDNGGTKSIIETTLLASNWVGDTAPYTYDLGLGNTADLEVLLPNTATADVVEIVTKAQMASNGNDNLIRAWGDKPTVDIPVIIRKVG